MSSSMRLHSSTLFLNPLRNASYIMNITVSGEAAKGGLKTNDSRAEEISDQEYLRQRLTPAPGDPLYLHLSDLLLALEGCAEQVSGRLLDYGCGGSPYRSLFRNCHYLRADYLDTGDLDYTLGGDSRLPADVGRFDCVLSTQVLEHVPEPEGYIREIRRVLKSDGKLILSTHGLFPDHGCPWDFQRWTADGLTRALRQGGFEVTRVRKLTCSTRAALFLGEPYMGNLWHSRRKMLGVALWAFERWFWKKRAERHRWIDGKFPEERVVDGGNLSAALYVAVIAEAVPVAG